MHETNDTPTPNTFPIDSELETSQDKADADDQTESKELANLIENTLEEIDFSPGKTDPRKILAKLEQTAINSGVPERIELKRGRKPASTTKSGTSRKRTNATNLSSLPATSAPGTTIDETTTVGETVADQVLIPISLQGAPESIQTAEPADGIEILVKLAETGEIDPKNVDIIDVTDKFLKAIAAAPKENLRQSGKVLFHACVLLRMKAEALLAYANAELDPGDDFLDFDDSDGLTIYDSHNQPIARQITLQDLERALVRKASVRPTRQRKVTLDQLILALREAEQIEKVRSEKRPRAPRIELSGHHQVNEYEDILELAHDEDIESTIERVEGILLEYVQTGQLMHLFNIVKLLDRHGDWVDAFLAVLFLSNAGKISLEQETFWGPLYIVRCDQQAAQQAVQQEPPQAS